MNEKQDIINRLIEKSAEIITKEEFTKRLKAKEKLTHYIGFEISGYVHIGQGIMSALIMKDLTDLGVQCTVWLADWHTWINDKLDGTKETAAKIGQGYFTEAIKASYKAVGGDPKDLEFRLASEWYKKDALKYMNLEKLVEKHTTLARMQRSISIMGKKEGESVDFASLTYPGMQAADIFYQEIDIAHAGMDQRKAHVIMRDVAEKIGKKKATAIHHPLLMSLRGPEDEKMSKSDPSSAIFVHDSPGEIEQKIKKAYCPEKETEDNPIIQWAEHLIFWSADWRKGKPVTIKRKEEHGGNLELKNFTALKTSYENGSLHPMDLKSMVADELIRLLAPVRQHFEQKDVVKKKKELDKILAKK